ncbi:FecR family protein [Chondrinema litorale]|uniref:FecR family protein n=1 Tax=Chondrinema litorale TaxID=2994555 RepID=UPI0025429268|nr:FecR domain-containing protein [Chondrinema litorale]UZR99213.1 DUF4974 domain-containing protein [Chondrinema litorale]
MNTEREKIRKLISDYLSNKIDSNQLNLFLDGFDKKEIEEEYDFVLKNHFDNLVLTEGFEQEENTENNEKLIEARSIIQKDPAKSIGFNGTSLWSSVSGIAATISIICCAVAVLWVTTQEKAPKEEDLPVISFEERYTQPGTKGSYTLSDGSFIHLNADSKLSFPQEFNGKERLVKMGGEAYFKVKRDEERPFVIEAEKIKIKVLGTSFNVKAYDEEDEIVVAVESGKVMVTDLKQNSKQFILTKNQKLVYSREENKFKVTDANISSDLIWREGVLKFNNTPFSEIERKLERWYGVDIQVEDKSVYSRKISGVHKNENLKAVLESIKFAFGIDYKINGKTVKLKTF